MRFRAATLDAIAAGDVTVAFRRRVHPTLKAGGTAVTRVGVLAIDALAGSLGTGCRLSPRGRVGPDR